MLFSKKANRIIGISVIVIIAASLLYIAYDRLMVDHVKHLDGNPETWYLAGSPEVSLEIGDGRFLISGSGQVYEDTVRYFGFDEGPWTPDDAHRSGSNGNEYKMMDGCIVTLGYDDFHGWDFIMIRKDIYYGTGSKFIREKIAY